MSDEHPLEYLSEIQDLVDLNDFMKDEDFEAAMELALKCAAKPDIPPAVARRALIQMQAWSFIFRMKSKTYDTIHKGRAGSEQNNKKNVYYSASEQCDKLASSLKYLSREHF